MDDLVNDIMRHPSAAPWVIAIGVITLLSARFPGILGSWGKALETWLASRRRAAELRDDADIADLRRQVKHLVGEVKRQEAEIAAMRRDQQARDAVLHAHYHWDVAAYQQIINLGGEIDPPPSVWLAAPAESPTRFAEPPGDETPTT